MRETNCEQIRRQIALGESPDSAEIAGHLRSCEACRSEVDRLGALITLLAADAEVAVRTDLDRQVRCRLRENSKPAPSILRPRLAIVLAAIALLAGIIAVVGLVAKGASPQDDFFLAFGIIWAYLAISSAATLPILIHKKVLIRQSICEV